MTALTHTGKDEAEQFLRFLFHPGDLVELRGVSCSGKKQSVMGGLFDDFERAAAAGAKISNLGRNVYYTVNPVDPSSPYAHGMLRNKLSNAMKVTAKNRDMRWRQTYFFDADPERAVKGTCSTDVEKAEALKVAQNAEAYLRSFGLPEPVWVDSGSGYHLLYKADTPLADPRLKAVMRALHNKLSTQFAKIDLAVYNDARLARLPGFLNRKGSNTADRPHRLAKLLSYPAAYDVASADMLDAIIVSQKALPLLQRSQSFHPESGELSKLQSGEAAILLKAADIYQLQIEYPDLIKIVKATTDTGGTIWFALDPCPFKGSSHSGMEVGRGKSCITVGPKGRVGFSCFSSACGKPSFSDLLNHLRKKTGRSFSLTIQGVRSERIAAPEISQGEDGRKQLAAPLITTPTSLEALKHSIRQKAICVDRLFEARQVRHRDRANRALASVDMNQVLSYIKNADWFLAQNAAMPSSLD